MTILPTRAGWRPAAAAVPLRAWRDAQRAAVRRALQAAQDAWEQDWGLAGSAPGLPEAAPPAEAERGNWVVLAGAGAARAWVLRPARFDAQLGQALWGMQPGPTPIAAALQATCADDLLGRLRAATQLLPARPDPAAAAPPPLAPWCGSIESHLRWGVSVRLEGEAAQAMLRGIAPGAEPHPARGALSPLQQALAGSRVALQVHLADCELAVGSLHDLQIGDVVPLPHPLRSPLQVRDGDGRPVFSALLARSRGCKAVQLAPLAAAAANEKVHP